MSEDDEAAKNARVASLRERIKVLKSAPADLTKVDCETHEIQPSKDYPSPKESTSESNESPREFIKRRMPELDKKK